MKIKSFKQWAEEQSSEITPELAYNAAFEQAQKEHALEYTISLEYYDSVLRRTSDITLDIAKSMVEVADLIPETEEVDYRHMRLLEDALVRFKKAVEDEINEDTI